MFIDLHGHSRKQNIFLYGCDERKKGLMRPAARLFPKVMNDKSILCYDDYTISICWMIRRHIYEKHRLHLDHKCSFMAYEGIQVEIVVQTDENILVT